MSIINKIAGQIKFIVPYLLKHIRITLSKIQGVKIYQNSGALGEIRAKNIVSSTDNVEDSSSSIYRVQLLKLCFLIITLIGFLYAFFNLSTSGAISPHGKSKTDSIASELSANNADNKTLKVEVASKSLDPELMWRSYFEEKLDEEKENSEKKLGLLAESVHMLQTESDKKTSGEIESLKLELQSAKNELNEAIAQMRDLSSVLVARNDVANNTHEINQDISSIYIEDDSNISVPRDAKLYIPETAYVEATLLGGISVSTSVGSQHEPVPVIMRVVGYGNLPKNFAVDLTKCRILGSSYGDLSSERAIIRAETLVCTNETTGEIITTKIAGQIYGDDGMNGIKGRVVDMSTKNIKNAAIGGMLSGFASTLKQNSTFAVTSMGAISADKQTFNERGKDNMLAGAGTAAEKIADYYIKQAESMSPVLLIPGGTRVDVGFTKGVYIGSSSVVSDINKERKSSEK